MPFTAEARATASDGGFQIVGHAAVFNSLSENLGLFDDWYELIAPGAFAAVLKKNPDVRALFNHDPNLVLARSKSGTLTLAEDAQGLRYLADVPEGLYYGDTLRILLERGDVDQSSFAFRVARNGDSWKEDAKGRLVRTIHQFSELYDVSPVTYPAYQAADSGLASVPVVEPVAANVAPARAARARRLQKLERIMKDDLAPARKERARALRRQGWG